MAYPADFHPAAQQMVETVLRITTNNDITLQMLTLTFDGHSVSTRPVIYMRAP